MILGLVFHPAIGQVVECNKRLFREVNRLWRAIKIDVALRPEVGVIGVAGKREKPLITACSALASASAFAITA